MPPAFRIVTEVQRYYVLLQRWNRCKLPTMQLTGKGAGRPLAGVVSALVVLALALVGAPAASAAPARSTSTSTPSSTVYRNPVSRSFADTYADPDVVRGKDGWWYAYAPSDPLR